MLGRTLDLELGDLGPVLVSVADLLCDLGQVSSPLTLDLVLLHL